MRVWARREAGNDGVGQEAGDDGVGREAGDEGVRRELGDEGGGQEVGDDEVDERWVMRLWGGRRVMRRWPRWETRRWSALERRKTRSGLL